MQSPRTNSDTPRKEASNEPEAGLRRPAVTYTREDAFSDALDRYRLPVMFVGILTLIGASRFEATRSGEAIFIALILPLALLAAGAAPFKDADAGLRVTGFGVALGVLALSELRIVSALFPALGAPLAPAALLWVVGGLAILTEAFGARHGTRSRLAACAGIALGLAMYLPGH
ncbi:MAG TPA: hypothetical protein VK524_05165, partial [Polyangiaceae bacterium]|nr:hypothetical protein [Polyangiaceae bacterium]